MFTPSEIVGLAGAELVISSLFIMSTSSTLTCAGFFLSVIYLGSSYAYFASSSLWKKMYSRATT